MGTNAVLKTKPPLPPKPQIKWGTPQKFLDSCSSSTTTTTDPQYRPTPKPRLSKPNYTPNQADNAEQASSFNKDTSSSNESSKSHSLSVCPSGCPCVCHNASQNIPKKNQEYEDHYKITFKNKDDKDRGRVPPNVPISARPLPKEPWKMIIRNVEITTDDGIYADADIPKPDDDTAPHRSETEPSGDALMISPLKPIAAARKRGKVKVEAKNQSKYQHDDGHEKLRNELCQIFSTKTKEELKTMKNKLSKVMISEEVHGTQPKSNLLSFQKKTNADKTEQKKSPISVKPLTTISSCSRSQSFQTSAKWPEQSNAALLPFSSLKVKRTRSCLENKEKDGHSWKILQGSLWQERCDVKKSGILNRITKEQLFLQESIYEVATSEQSYLEQLTVVVNHFMESPELNSIIAPQDQKTLFSNIQTIREISQNFLDSIVQKLGSSLSCEGLFDVVHDYAIGPFTAYVDYIRDMPCQKHTLINLRKESPRFVEILNKLQENPCCNRLPLDSFLSLPFQRLSHLKVLMETILKRTDSNSNVQASAAASKRISEVLELCNREVGKVKQIEELVNIANKIEFECKALPLVSASRWLIRHGEMTQLCLSENIFGQRKICHVYLILFNDLLLVASKKGSDRYVVHDHAHRSLIEVTEGAKMEDDLEGYAVSRVFVLVILKNHRGVSHQLLLKASTLEERDSWLQVLKSEEGVYEEWGCPQVRCIEEYNGQKPGELSLQPEDMVSIIQKTSKGLMEGRRFSDGERGWFPAKCVMEISNEHVQRRNLRQRHHVLQAAASILKRRSISQDQQTTTCFKKLL